MTSVVAGPMFLIGSPQLAHQVLHAPSGTYLAGAANRRILPVLPEETLLTLDGEPHRDRRRQLAPLFHSESLRAIGPLVRDLTSSEIRSWPVGQPFEVLPRMRALTLNVAARMILGTRSDDAVAQVQRCLSSVLQPYAMLAGYEGLRQLGPASPQTAAGRGLRRFAECGAEGGRAEQAPAPLSRSDMYGPGTNEAFALLLAAHETTATALAWAIHELARAPEVADALAYEPPTGHRPWLDAVAWETLRLDPPLIDIVRQPAEPVELAGRCVPAGTLLLIPPALIQHSGTFLEPERSRPERFPGTPP